MHAMYRVGGVRTVTEAGDRSLYAPRDPEEVSSSLLLSSLELSDTQVYEP